MAYSFAMMESPVGRLKLVAGASGLCAVMWAQDRPRRVRLDPLTEEPSHPVLAETERQLGAYFAGRRTMFELPLEPVGTAFQKAVWAASRRIPFGQTRSYGEIARAIGAPRAVRAVGAANGRNPIAIVVPCHRVIGAAGALTGFAGGLEAKATLLALEGGRYGPDVTAVSRDRRRGSAARAESPGLFGDL